MPHAFPVALIAGTLLGARAGQPEFAERMALLGEQGAAIPFLRYLPERLTPPGVRVEAVLRERLAAGPSFVAFEGYDTVAALVELLRAHRADRTRIAEVWPCVAVDGTRGPIRFSRVAGVGVWQWASAPIQWSIAIRCSAIAFASFTTARRDHPELLGSGGHIRSEPRQAACCYPLRQAIVDEDLAAMRRHPPRQHALRWRKGRKSRPRVG